jgi:hypothetical protein
MSAPAELDEVPHHQEVAGEPELLDDVELVVDGAPTPGGGQVLSGWPSRRWFAPPGEGLTPSVDARRTCRRRHLGQERRYCISDSTRPSTSGTGTAAGSGRPATGRTPPPGRSRPPARPRPGSGRTGGAARHPTGGARRRMPGSHGSSSSRLRRARTAAMAVASAAAPGGVVDVVGGHALDADPVGDLDQRVVAGRVDRVAVVPQLDQHPVAPERAHQPLELAAGG